MLILKGRPIFYPGKAGHLYGPRVGFGLGRACWHHVMCLDFFGEGSKNNVKRPIININKSF